VGLHLNLTEGTPVLGLPPPPTPTPTPLAAEAAAAAAAAAHRPTTLLADDPSPLDGRRYMRGKFGLREGLASGAVRPSDAAAEAEAQLARFVLLQLDDPPASASASAAPAMAPSPFVLPTHWDGHQHVHVHPLLAGPLASVFARAGLVTKTRLPELGPDLLPPDFPAARAAVYTELSAQARDARQVFAKAHADEANASPTTPPPPSPIVFAGYTTMGADMTVERVKEVLGRAFALAGEGGCVEWMVHPGLRTPGSATRAEAGCGDGPDDFSVSPDREAEMELLLDKDGELRAWLKEKGVRLVGYDEV
jgi:predicted glycoside hydrolase/deacetylase ChbG (UPF0249 family)